MTTIATPPAAALDAVLDRVRAGKALTPAEADLLSAGVTGLRRTAGGLQRRSQQQAARINELVDEADRLRRLGADLDKRSAALEERVARVAATAGPLLAAPEPPLRDRIAAAIRAAACPGCCPVPHACHLTRPQPTVWDQNGRVLEVEISGPIDRVAAIIAGALAGEAP